MPTALTYDELVATVRRYWNDKSRSPAQTRDDLSNLVDEIEMMRDALYHDDPTIAD
jgi:hypothetical protein